MKPKYSRRLPLFLAISLSVAGPAAAATLYWDGTDTTANADGGTGTWSTANAWDNAAIGGANATFATSDTAVFGGTAGTVTASAALTAAATTFSTSGYTLNLTATAATAYTLGTLTGAPTINVTLGTGTATASFGATTNFAAFSGIINVGTASQAAGSGKAQINSSAGPLPAGAAVNVRTNSTLYVSSALTHLAPITLNGGDTGEALGQLRLEGGANWGGPVTIAGDITSTGDAHLGSNTGAVGTVSGNIGESGGSRTLIKGGGGTITLAGTNTFTGGTIVRTGGLTLDNTNNNGNKLSDSAAIQLGSAATLRFTGNAEAATSEIINGLTLLGASVTIALDTAAGQTLTADFTGGGSGILTNSNYGLNVTMSGTGTPQLKLPGTTPNSLLPMVTLNGSSFASTDASNYVVGSTLNSTDYDLAAWTSGATQYTTTGTDFINQVGAGVAIDGISFLDAAARTVTIGTGNTLSLAKGIIEISAVGNNLSKITGGSLRATTAGGVLAISQKNSSNNLVIESTIADNGGSSLAKGGGGVLELNAANSYAGGTLLNSGVIRLGNLGALGTGPLTLASTNASALSLINLPGSLNFMNNITLDNFTTATTTGVYAAGGAADVLQLSGTISGGGANTTFRLHNAATTNPGVKFIISGNNTYSGKTLCLEGGAQLNHPNGFGSSAVEFNQTGDCVLLFGSAMTVANPMSYTYDTKRLDTNGNDVTLTGVQTFTAPVSKTGAGKLTLTNINAGTAALTISSGSLALGAGGSLLNNTITVASGAVLDVSAVSGGFSIATGKTLAAGDANAAADVVGNLVLASGTGAISPASDSATGTLTVDGNLTLNGGTLRWSGLDDKVALAGASRSLILSGTNTVTASAGGVLAPGTYTLVSGYTSHSGDASNLSYNSAVTRGGSHSWDVGANTTTLTVSGTPMNLTWSGAAASTVWDVNTTANWNANAEKFYQLDSVTFSDSPLNATVTINGTVVPAAIAFTNATTSYIVRGGTSPVIGGTAAMTKSGAATVTLWHPSNIYTGGTTINAGTLNLNLGATVTTGYYSPLGTGPVTINPTGTLQLNPGNGGTNIYTFPNALRLAGGTLYANDGNSIFSGTVTVEATSTIKTEYGGKQLTLGGGLAGGANLTISDQPGAYGNGTVFLTAAGTYSGTVTIDNASGANGALTLTHANALQNAKVAVNTDAANDGYSTTPNSSGLILAGSGGTNYTIAGLSGTQGAARIHNANDTNTRTLTVNQSTDSSFAGAIGGTSANTSRLNLVKSGTGVLTLGGSDTYTGNTTVSGGKLVLKTRTSSTMNLTVADGAALGVDSTGGSLSVNQVTLGTSGTTTLAITNFPANSNPIINCKNLANQSTTTISVSGTLAVGTYPLIQASSTFTGAGTFALVPLPRGVSGGLETGNTYVDLVITGFDSLIWTGGTDAVWNTAQPNWRLGTSIPATYQDGDNVLFDGTGANRTVTLDSTVTPGSLTFSGNQDHSIIGTGAIGGATGIVKNGIGKLTLATPNTFSGVVAVDEGNLTLGNSAALGGTGSGTTVADGATLELNGISPGSEKLSMDGSLLNNSTTGATLAGAITLTGDALIGGSGNLTLTAKAAGSYSLEKTGTGVLTFSTVSSAITGNLTINGGRVDFSTPNYNRAIGASTGIIVNDTGTLRLNSTNVLYDGGLATSIPVTVNAGGTVEINSNHNHFYALNLNGGTVTGLGSGHYNGEYSTLDATITIGGTQMSAMNGTGTGVYNLNGATFDVGDAATGTDLLISTKLTGTALTKNGAGSMKLTGDNSYTGATTVNGGALIVNGNQSAATGAVTVSNAGTILAGTGGLGGATTLNADTILAPGDGGIESLATGALTLAGTYQCELDATTADVVNVTGDLTLTGAILDLTGTAMANSYIIASYTGTRTGQFATLNGLTGGYSVVYDDANKLVKVAKPGYATWAADNAPIGTAKDDFDGDGVPNGVEYVLGGSKATNDLAKLPKVGASGGDLTFIFTRNKDTIADTTVAIQVDADMVDWPTAGANYYLVPATPVANNPGVTVVDNSPANTQTITLTVPVSSAASNFARLEVKIK